MYHSGSDSRPIEKPSRCRLAHAARGNEAGFCGAYEVTSQIYFNRYERPVAAQVRPKPASVDFEMTPNSASVQVRPIYFGGSRGNRTHNLRVKSPLLCQLS